MCVCLSISAYTYGQTTTSVTSTIQYNTIHRLLINRMFYSTVPPACSLLTILLLAQMYKLYILYFAISCILPVVTVAVTAAVLPTVLSCVAVVCYTIVHVIVTFAAVCLRLQ